MTTTIDGQQGVDRVKAGSIEQTDLAPNVAGNGPAFRASGASQTSSSGATVQLNFTAVQFDSNNNFDLTTDTFTPTVAGTYLVTVRAWTGVNTNNSSITTLIYKNGAVYSDAIADNVAGFSAVACLSDLVEVNGTTDYITFYARNADNANIGPFSASASLVRAA